MGRFCIEFEPHSAARHFQIESAAHQDHGLSGVLPAESDSLSVLLRMLRGIVEHAAQGSGVLLLVGNEFCRVAVLNIENAVVSNFSRLGLRVCQQRYRQHSSQNYRRQNHPECRLLVVEYRFDPLLHAHLTEGQGAGSDASGIDGAAEQGRGVGLLFSGAVIADHLLVAGQLDVPAQQKIGQPHGGIEPVDRQQRKAQGLPPVIPAGDVCLLVGDHMAPGGLIQVGGQVDLRTEQAENEGRADAVAEEHAVSRDGFPYLPPDPVTGDHRPQAHDHHTQHPDVGEHRQPDLQGIDTGTRCRSERFGIHGVYNVVHDRHAAVNDGGLVKEAFGWDDLRAGDQTEGGFEAAEDQPQGHQRPEGADHPPGRFLQKQPCQYHAQHHPDGGNAGVQHIEKQIGHGHTSSKVSIIRRISSISALDRDRRRVKAARNDGRFPEKFSSTNRSDCMA